MFQMDPKTAKAIKKYPNNAVDIAQSYDEKQIKCKQWVYDELLNIPIPQPKRIYVAGSWYGNIISPLITNLYPGVELRLHDIDEQVIKISKSIFFKDNLNIKPELVDCSQYLYKYFVINTSCEHMEPLKIRNGSYVVLQSNNYREVSDHINCVDSAEELAHQYNVSEIYYQGELKFEKYTRFMAIGRI